MSDIFLSYSSADRDLLRPLVRMLEDHGWSVFWDRKIPVGQTWRGVIGREITDCLCIVVVWTKNSVQSEWVMEEAEEGKNRRILFPVSLDGTRPPFGFGSIQSADFSTWEGGTEHSGYKLLIGELTKHIQGIKDQQETERQRQEKKLKEQAEVEQRKQEEIARKERENQQRLPNKKEQTEQKAREQQEKLAKQQAEQETKEAEQQAKLEAEYQAKFEAEKKKAEREAREQLAKEKAERELQEEKNQKAQETDKASALEKEHREAQKLAQHAKQTLAREEADNENKYKAVNNPDTQKVQASKKKQVVIGLTGIFALATAGFFWFNTNPKLKNIELSDDMFPEMVSIPSGNFTMGCVSGKDCNDDEKPTHEVYISEFEMSKYEVTFKQWDACFEDGDCEEKADDAGWGRDNRPVTNVSWEDAQQYVKWLSRRTGEQYRLPSEAEWEYTARSGSETAYSWGNTIGHNNANCDGCGSKWDDEKTASVGSFSANQYGLHDMHGNVWEWTQDCWNDTYQGAPDDGTAWKSGNCDRRVLRGGSWDYRPRSLRSANRGSNFPLYRDNYNGFRVARTP